METLIKITYFQLKYIVISIYIVLLVLHTIQSNHDCIHDEKLKLFMKTVDLESFVTHIHNIESVNGTRRLQTSSTIFRPIRIIFDTSKLNTDPGYACKAEDDEVLLDNSKYICTDNDILTSTKREMIITVLLGQIKSYFESILSVKPIDGTLYLRGISCGSDASWACCANSIPKYFYETGVTGADFVLHVTARPTAGSTIAWALPCNLDNFGRPVSGHVNFGPNRIDVSTRARNEQIGTALHETSHALGFSKSRFNDFRQPFNGPKWGENNIFYRSIERDVQVTKLITPKIVREIKKHFNCPNWGINAGAELENGPSGSSDYSSHWEKRIFGTEYMTATSNYYPIYSAVTLALFEDSGWYVANYDLAQVLPWGYHEGCSFVTSKCSDWSKRYFCSVQNEQKCTPDFIGKGYCNLQTYTSSIPAGFQYFTQPSYGGRDSYEDYCPLYKIYTNGDCMGNGRIDSFFNKNYGEVVGPSSRCFESNLDKSSSSALMRTNCYKINGCTSTSMELLIGGDTKVNCPLAGGEISVPGYYGKLICPVSNNLCQMIKDKCAGTGVLLSSGLCSCNAGFTGSDCSLKECPKNNNNVECSGNGECDTKTGVCKCNAAFTGLSCMELTCPSFSNNKNASECSGHGFCNRLAGSCTCVDGYSGKACECVPGCSSLPLSTQCNSNGECDCPTGSCACKAGYRGLNCELLGDPIITELYLNQSQLNGKIINRREYTYYKVWLHDSTSDITIILLSDINNKYGDADLYGSFYVTYPNALTSKSILMSSNRGTKRDEIHLCGNGGTFPRAINDTFRYCGSVNTYFIEKTPGYFYFSVYGYNSTSYSLSIEMDKCVNSTCSGHGSCGKLIAGICSCDRLWSGNLCETPKCRPDCYDTDINCVINGTTAELQDISSTSIGLSKINQCYGNGECRVSISPSTGKEIPACVCDSAYYYEKPTDSQSICKELVPSVAYISKMNGSFFILANSLQSMLKTYQWAMYSITISDKIEYICIKLDITTSMSDAMLFIRKVKIPSIDDDSFFPIQYMDSNSWTGQKNNHKICLHRGGSSISTGLYYIGVYNSKYSRNSLGYQLNTTLYINQNTTNPLKNNTEVCSGNGILSLVGSSICLCNLGYAGDYCEYSITHYKIKNMETTSIVIEPNGLLSVGKYSFYSFELNNTLPVEAATITFKMLNPDNVETNQANLIPITPLLFVRDASQTGIPTLNKDSFYDFFGSETQSVSIDLSKPCIGLDCYKIGVHNRIYSGGILSYSLTIYLFPSTDLLFDNDLCQNINVKSNQNVISGCNGKGTCNKDNDNNQKCECLQNWKGFNCNSPKAFDLQQIWKAAKNITILCNECDKKLLLKRGELIFFQIPEPLKPNAALRLQIRSINERSNSNQTSIPRPDIYISEVLPRSIYDFRYVSTTDNVLNVATINITKRSLSGHFYAAIFSPTEMYNLEKVNNTQLVSNLKKNIRFLSDEKIKYDFILQSSLYYYKDNNEIKSLIITDQSFVKLLWTWLTKSTFGIYVFIIASVFTFILIMFCIWRTIRSPDNQDKVLKKLVDENNKRNAVVLREKEENLKINIQTDSMDEEDEEEKQEHSPMNKKPNLTNPTFKSDIKSPKNQNPTI